MLHFFGKNQTKETWYASDFFDQVILLPSFTKEAENTFLGMANHVPEIKQLDRLPQSPPLHAEGPVIGDRIRRMLATLFAISQGEQLLQIEEFAREKHLHADFEHLQFTIQEHVGTLYAFILLHALGRNNALEFHASEHADAAKDGLFQHRNRKDSAITESEMSLYLKLFKGVDAAYSYLPKHQVMGRFFDRYEIEVRLSNEKRIEIPENTVHGIAEELRLPERDRALLRFILKQFHYCVHIFEQGVSPNKIGVLERRAARAGFDAADAIDLLVCAVFFTTCAGSLRYEHGEFSVATHAVLHMIRSEEQYAAQHRSRRKELVEQRKNATLKALLARHALDADTLFTELNIPFGPERGDLMDKVKFQVQSSSDIDFGEYTHVLESRILAARADFDAGLNA